jgi:hypothetical protein
MSLAVLVMTAASFSAAGTGWLFVNYSRLKSRACRKGFLSRRIGFPFNNLPGYSRLAQVPQEPVWRSAN